MNRAAFHAMTHTQRADYLRLRLLREVYRHYAAAKVDTAPQARAVTVDHISHIYSAGHRREVHTHAHAA
mgnify:CR=1 FL=1